MQDGGGDRGEQFGTIDPHERNLRLRRRRRWTDCPEPIVVLCYASQRWWGTKQYRFTVDDPATFTKPFTVVSPMQRLTDKIYEYACHEGNVAMHGILSGARAQERENDRKK